MSVAYREENRQTWRASLRKSLRPMPNFVKLSQARRQAVEDMQSELFSFKGVSLAFLNKFWRSVRNRERYSSVELYEVVDGVEGVPVGATVSKVESLQVDEESIQLRCWYPNNDEFVSLWATQVKWKDRKYWTVEDLCQFGLFPDTDLTHEPYIARLDSGSLGKDFEGRYVVYPRSCCFEDLLISIRNYVGDQGTTPAEDSYFWIDVFSTNIAMIEHFQNQGGSTPGAGKDFLSLLGQYKQTALELFDTRFVYFDNWKEPKVLKSLWCVWEISELFKADLSFEILVEKQTASHFVTVYDSDEDGVFSMIETMDPTRLQHENSKDKKFIVEHLTNNLEGFLTVKKLLKKKFSRWFVKEVEDDVKNFPDGGDHISMEKFAIFLYKTGNYLRKHGEISVAKSYFMKALEHYKDLQDYKQQMLEHNRTTELTLQDQLAIDRVNGGASKTNLYLALICIKESQFVHAEKHLNQAELEAKKLRTPKHAFIADISEARAEMYSKLGKHEGAIQELLTVAMILRDDPEANRIRYGNLEFRIGILYKEQLDRKTAGAALKRAKEIQQKVLGVNHALYARTLMAEASLSFREGFLDEALNGYRYAQEILLKQVGSMNVDVAKAYSNIGQCYARQGKYDNALENYHQSITSYKHATGKYSVGIATAMNSVALVLREKGDLGAAVETFQKTVLVLEKVKEIRDQNHEDMTKQEQQRLKSLLATIFSNLGQTYERDQKLSGAISSYKKSYELTKDLLGEEASKTKDRLQRWKKLAF